METSTRFGFKSMPTYYKGITFRSRLEARWAIILDELGIAWEYEPEAIVIESSIWFADPQNRDVMSYLPDFYLPEHKAFVEVKGSLDEAEYWKIIRIAHNLARDDDHKYAFFLAGNIGSEKHHRPALHSLTNHEGLIYAAHVGFNYKNSDPLYNSVIGYDAGIEYTDAKIDCVYELLLHNHDINPYESDRLIFAANVARNARFDRGHHV
jgi:hypothetical protein